MTKKSIGSGRGSVYNILLKALQTGDKYAYEICKEVEEKTNGDYILNQQSSYSGLKRLEQRQEITSYWKDSDLGGRRHYYSLTEKGRKRLESSNFSWEDARDQIVDTLFEKSKVDKAIDDVNGDIEEIKNTTFLPKSEQADIDEVLSRTENLLNNQNQIKIENDVETNATGTKTTDDVQNQTELTGSNPSQSGQLDDLFSLFNQSSQNINDSKNSSDTTKMIDETASIEQNNTNQSAKTNGEFQTSDNLAKSNETHQPEKESQSSFAEQTSDLFSFATPSTKSTKESMSTQNETDTQNDVKRERDIQFEDQDSIKTQSTEIEQNPKYESPNSTNSNDLNNHTFEQVDDNNSVEMNNDGTANNSFEKNTEIEPSSEQPQSSTSQSNSIPKVDETNNNQSHQTQKNQFDELLKNMQTILDENNFGNEHFEQTKVHTKQLSKNQDSFDSYRQNHQSSNFMEHTYYEKPSTSYFDDTFGIPSNQIEKEDGDSPMTFDTQRNESIQQNETQSSGNNAEKSGEVVQNQNNDENSTSKTIGVEKKQSSIDYTIFGDLVSTQDTIQNETSQNTADEHSQSPSDQEKIGSDDIQSQEETNQQVDSESNNDKNHLHKQNETFGTANSNELQNKQSTSPLSILEDLPYKPIKDNINQTLAPNGYTGSESDLIYDTSSNYNSNYKSEYIGFDDPYANSEYDRWGDKKQTSQSTQTDAQNQKMIQNQQNWQSQNDYVPQQQEPNFDAMPTQSQFDRQYQGISNEIFVPNQVIRYYKKQDERHTNSRYVLINKLNLFATIILGFLLAIFNTIALVLCKSVFASPKMQIVVCDIIYALIAIAIALSLAKYIFNKSRRANNLGKSDFVISIAVALVVTILTIAINIENGMTFKNIGSYFSSFAMPIAFSIELLFVHLTKKILAKSAKFYE